MFVASSSDAGSAVGTGRDRWSETDGKDVTVVTGGDKSSETDGKEVPALLLEEIDQVMERY